MTSIEEALSVAKVGTELVKLSGEAAGSLGSFLLALLNDRRAANAPKADIDEIQEAIDNLKMSKAKAAQALGYLICRKCYPPEVMIVVGYRRPENEREEQHHADTVSGGISKGYTSVPPYIMVNGCRVCGLTDAFDKPYVQTVILPRTRVYNLNLDQSAGTGLICSEATGCHRFTSD